LAGLDFCERFPEEESLISPEWSSQGLFALRALLAFYETGKGQGRLQANELMSLHRDEESMVKFLRRSPNSYAIGPGHGGGRLGQTGFGWICPPPEVHAMPSLLLALYLEGKRNPAAWWRKP
jgi:hypothetical protein